MIKSVDSFVACKDYSYPRLLDADPQSEQEAPNQKSREVRSGHFVPVKPTPLAQPKLIIASREMANELGLNEELSSDMIRFLGADQDALPGMDFSWATPYALAIYGQPMYQQCPFGNGRGYGDGRAISIAEVKLESGARWELQLKGAGGTPFRRTGDGRAVLRSSIREFLASEAMFNLGVSTTRALSLVVSGSETVARPWFSPNAAQKLTIDDPRLARYGLERRKQIVAQFNSQPAEPDRMQMEPIAISCRVAPSFIRVGHFDLFARRARGEVPGVKGIELEQDAKVGLEQLQKLVDFALFREFPNRPATGLELLRASSQGIAQLTANWMRVGFVQGNFNSDNCLVAGRQMDYGPFGFMEMFNPRWAMWVGGGHHFSFINQTQAGIKNFETLVDSIKPILSAQDQKEADKLAANQLAVATDALNDVWRRKLGIAGDWSPEADAVISQMLQLMEASAADWTLTWRLLANLVEEPNSNLTILQNAFYTWPLSEQLTKAWTEWINAYRSLIPSDSNVAEIAASMRLANPKYVPREWMLVEAYEHAYKGDYSMVHELYELFRNPYMEQPEFESKYFRKAAADVLDRPGTAYMT